MRQTIILLCPCYTLIPVFSITFPFSYKVFRYRLAHAIFCRGQRHKLFLTASLSATMYKRVICECNVVPGYCESRKQLCNWSYSCGIRLWPGTWEVDWDCHLRSKSRGSIWFPPWRRRVLGCCCVYCCLQVENSPLTNTFDSLEEGIEYRWGSDSVVRASGDHKNRGLTCCQQKRLW